MHADERRGQPIDQRRDQGCDRGVGGVGPVRNQAVELASPEHRGPVDQPTRAGPPGAVAVALEGALAVAHREVVERGVPHQVRAERRLLVGGREPVGEPGDAPGVVAALEEDMGQRVAAGEPGRVQLEGTGGEPVGLLEPALVLGDHPLEADERGVLPHGVARGPYARQGPVLGVGVGRGQGEEDGHAQAEQVGREPLLVAVPGRTRGPDPLAVGGQGRLGEGPLPVVVGTTPTGRRRLGHRVEVGGVEEGDQDGGSPGDGQVGVGLDHLAQRGLGSRPAAHVTVHEPVPERRGVGIGGQPQRTGHLPGPWKLTLDLWPGARQNQRRGPETTRGPPHRGAGSLSVSV